MQFENIELAKVDRKLARFQIEVASGLVKFQLVSEVSAVAWNVRQSLHI